jgi:MFS family permease
VTPPDTTARRDRWVIVGMAVAAISAAVASFAGLRGLAQLAGWPDQLAWLLPVTIDAYAMTSARVWLAGTLGSSHARGFARANAIGAIATSIVGNAGYHLIATGLVAISWPIVILVGAVPAAVLGLTAHLHALTTFTASDRDPAPATEDRPAARTRVRTGDHIDAALLKAAREADARHRAEHDGRPISRDSLRSALRIAGPKATALRRRLAAESPQPTESTDRKEASPHS